MFAGIVETTAPIRAARRARGSLAVSIEKSRRWRLAKGERGSVDGICTTGLSSTPRPYFVSGHVDASARVISLSKTARRGFLLPLALSKALMRFIALHGSLAVNGVSLTVARLAGARITVALIPHTVLRTNLGALKKGDRVNVEVDLAARYIL